MNRSYTFMKCQTFIKVTTDGSGVVKIPLVQGILKHPDRDSLPRLLKRKEVLLKYTNEALRKASWQILSAFPRKWLKSHMAGANLSGGRKKALTFLLTD